MDQALQHSAGIRYTNFMLIKHYPEPVETLPYFDSPASDQLGFSIHILCRGDCGNRLRVQNLYCTALGVSAVPSRPLYKSMVTTNARKARRAAAAVGAGSGAKPGEVKSIASDPGKAKNVISLNGSNDSNVKGNGQHAASRSPRGKDSTSKRGKRRNGRRSNGGGGRGGDGEAEVDRDVTQEKPVAVKTGTIIGSSGK